MAEHLPVPKDRNLYLSKQVNQESMLSLTEKIIEINENDTRLKKIYKFQGIKYKPKPIKIFIDSYGGQVYNCFGLLSIMEASKTPIHTYVTGCAMSCGFIIAIHGHKRFVFPNATLMYHQVSSGVWGKAVEMEAEIAEVKRLQGEIEKMVLKRTAIPKERLQRSYVEREDWHINAKEALKLKCVDEIKTEL